MKPPIIAKFTIRKICEKSKKKLQSSDALPKTKVPRRDQSSLNQQEGGNVQSEGAALDKHANWGGKKKLLCRMWSSFLQKSVVIMIGGSSPWECASLMAAGGPRGPSAYGVWRSGGEEAAVLLMGHQR